MDPELCDTQLFCPTTMFRNCLSNCPETALISFLIVRVPLRHGTGLPEGIRIQNYDFQSLSLNNKGTIKTIWTNGTQTSSNNCLTGWNTNHPLWPVLSLSNKLNKGLGRWVDGRMPPMAWLRYYWLRWTKRQEVCLWKNPRAHAHSSWLWKSQFSF